MQNYKYKLLYVLILLFVLPLASCSGTNDEIQNENKTTVLCTTFPQYDWTSTLLSGCDNVNIEYLLGNGSDIHSLNPSVEDIAKINTCDLLIYVGGESEDAIKKIIENSKKPLSQTFNMMDSINEKLLFEDSDEEHQHLHHENQVEKEYDEHIWLSLKNAKVIIEGLSDKLCEILPQHKNAILKNKNLYLKELNTLDMEYEAVISNAPKKQLLFADRFPYKYLENDYQLECFKAFSGCSSEIEASFSKILELSSKVDEYDLKYVIVLKGGSTDIANSVIYNTSSKSQEILYINSLQSVSSIDIENGVSYINEMKTTLDIIKKALYE